MESFRIRNLRCLADTGFIPIKPLTILVGANSSGKSTFIRTLPLLRQSIETPTNSPVLWYGRYVDFGTISDAVRENSTEKTVIFDFKIELPEDMTLHNYKEIKIHDASEITISLHLSPKSDNEQQTYVSALGVAVGSNNATLVLDKNGKVDNFTVNERSFKDNIKHLGIAPIAYFIPNIVDITSGKMPKTVYQAYAPRFRPMFFYHGIQNGLGKEFFSPISKYFFSTTTLQTLMDIASKTGIGDSANFLQRLKVAGGPDTWKRNIKSLTSRDADTKLIEDVLFASLIPFLLSFSDSSVSSFASGIQYVGPMRATAERFYRAQDLSVNEVDFRGENLAMYLNSLSDTQKKQFSEWAEENFNIHVSISRSGGHIKIIVRERGHEGKNLADVGFGYSQVLPIIAHLWSLQNTGTAQRFRNQLSITAIEQPELHLHPHMQAMLADTFVKMTSRKIKLFIETHSETIINRVGQLIQKQEISKDDVQVILFDKNNDEKSTSVRITGFDNEGCLQNWPFGFFYPGVD